MTVEDGGHVDGHATGWTELRVHGVAGTPAADVLQHPHVALAAGYAQAGFFRRWWEARSSSPDTAWSRREAYSWGGLTSGDNTRALWLLLLPFMLLNVAYFMAPSRRPPDPAPGTTPARAVAARRLERFSGSVQALLALSFTATFALAAVTVAMDLVGWQCGQGPAAGCGRWYLAWLLDRPGLAGTGRQLAVTALAPLAVVGLLWWLARTTWRNLEAVDVRQSAGPGGPEVVTPLEDRALWNGRVAVRRLRALHVALGLALPGVFALAPLDAAPRVPRTVVLALLLALVALVVVLAALPSTRRRSRPVAGAPPERADPIRRLPLVALGLTVLALATAAATPGTAGRPTSTLPWLVGTELWLFAGQAGLLVVLLGIALVLRRPAPAPPSCASGRPVAVAPAWSGLAMPGIALLAWVLAGGFSAGVILRVARTLGTPVSRGQPSAATYPLVIPSAVSWAAVGGLVLGVVALVVGLTTWLRVRSGPLRSVARVVAAYPEAAADDRVTVERRDQIARAWDVAGELPARAQRAAGWLLVATLAVVLLGIAGFLVVGPGLLRAVPGLVEAADVAISGFVLALVTVGRQAYRSPMTRRTVGILWDLGTFWPRAVHPLAPPCYAERAVPDLLLRLQHYARSGGRVLLSCHSQGSVLGAVVLLQVETAVSARVAFLTYGSPLSRLYGGFFPAYFTPTALDRLGGFLAAEPGAGRAGWRWRNLHRPSDPVGGAVFCARDPAAQPPDADPGDVDRVLRDPVFARPSGDPCYPPVLGHSNYFADPAFSWTTGALRDGLLPRPDVTA